MTAWDHLLPIELGYAVTAGGLLLIILGGVFLNVIYNLHSWKEKSREQQTKEKTYFTVLIIFIISLFLIIPDFREILFALLRDL
jgi:hypothetical protein